MIASYLRASTDKQDLETQRTRIQEHCDRRNITSQEFADDGVSSKVLFHDRPQSRQLLDLAKQGKVDEIVVYKLDRLGRDHPDTYTTIGLLLGLGVKINSLKEGLVENNASGRLKTGVLTLFGQHERESIVERSADSSRRLAQPAGTETQWMGGVAPYGYRQVGEDRKARLALSEEPISPTCKFSEVDVVRLIFQKAAAGETCYSIAKHLNNDLGIPAPYADPQRDQRRGGRSGREKKSRTTKGIWWSIRVRDVIVNATYKGTHYWGKTRSTKVEGRKNRPKPAPRDQWISRPCPAIVTEDLWAQANAMLHRHGTATMGHPKHQYLLRGLIRCHCGRTYIGVTAKQHNGKERAYYRCASKYADRSIRDTCPRCPAPGLRGEALEASIWEYVAGFLARPGLAVQKLREQMATEEDPGRRIEREIKALEDTLRGRSEARERVLAQVGQGLFRDDEIGRELRRIEDAAVKAEESLMELRKVSDVRQTRVLALDFAGRLLGDLRGKLLAGKLDFKKKRKFLEVLVAGISVTPVDGQKLPAVEVTFRFDSDLERAQSWKSPGQVFSHTGTTPP